MARKAESRRAAALKAAKTRADRRAAAVSQADRRPSPPPPLPPRRERAPRTRRRANTLDEDEDERDDGEDDAREASERERWQQQRHGEERARALERQRMEEELRARVEERERRAAEEIEANTQDAEAQWQIRMDELYAREAAVPQAGMWAAAAPPVGNAGIQRREIRYNGPEEGQGFLDKIPIRGPPQGTDLPFFHDLRLEFPSISETLLRSVVNNTMRPVNVMKLSTEFSEGKADKDEDEDFDSADIKGVTHLLRCFTIYSSILFRTVPPGVQTPLIAALLAYIDRLFGYSMVYTLDSIKKFHLVYHNTRMHTGVTDPSGWGQWEQALVDRHLRAREQITTTRRSAKDTSGLAVASTSHPLTQRRPWMGSTALPFQERFPCILWNQGRTCPPYCRFLHTCLSCKGEHPLMSCPTRPSSASQTPWAGAPPNPPYPASSWPSGRNAGPAQQAPWQDLAPPPNANQAPLGRERRR